MGCSKTCGGPLHEGHLLLQINQSGCPKRPPSPHAFETNLQRAPSWEGMRFPSCFAQRQSGSLQIRRTKGTTASRGDQPQLYQKKIACSALFFASLSVVGEIFVIRGLFPAGVQEGLGVALHRLFRSRTSRLKAIWRQALPARRRLACRPEGHPISGFGVLGRRRIQSGLMEATDDVGPRGDVG